MRAALAASSLFAINWIIIPSVQHSRAASVVAAAAADADVFRCYQAKVGGKAPPPQQKATTMKTFETSCGHEFLTAFAWFATIPSPSPSPSPSPLPSPSPPRLMPSSS